MLHTVLKKQIDRYLLECASRDLKVSLADLASEAGMTKQKLEALMSGVSRDITFEQFCILGTVMGVNNFDKAEGVLFTTSDWVQAWLNFRLPEYIKSGKLVIEIPIEQRYAALKDRAFDILHEVFESQLRNIQGFMKG